MPFLDIQLDNILEIKEAIAAEVRGAQHFGRFQRGAFAFPQSAD